MLLEKSEICFPMFFVFVVSFVYLLVDGRSTLNACRRRDPPPTSTPKSYGTPYPQRRTERNQDHCTALAKTLALVRVERAWCTACATVRALISLGSVFMFGLGASIVHTMGSLGQVLIRASQTRL